MAKNWKVVKMASDAHGREVRVLEADGKFYWQTQHKQHEAMPYTWGDGLVGLMPDSTSVDDAIAQMLNNPMQWEYDNAEGTLPYVPKTLWHDAL